MRFGSVLCLIGGFALLLAAPAAQAANWVHTRDTASGNPMCIDKDSITTRADGLTYWISKMCSDPTGQLYAVDCTTNFKVELLVRIYDVGSSDRYREMTMDYPESGLAVDADMACHKN
jgi:hypothetical protein